MLKFRAFALRFFLSKFAILLREILPPAFLLEGFKAIARSVCYQPNVRILPRATTCITRVHVWHGTAEWLICLDCVVKATRWRITTTRSPWTRIRRWTTSATRARCATRNTSKSSTQAVSFARVLPFYEISRESIIIGHYWCV